ncbi:MULTISPECIES: acyl carrier protein [Fusobacterium]|uniref:acyl carrier protein n=1 Tax=Fusobacterium TaxID=848 RepID=UPI001477480C|nr:MULTISPECIES: acyl carrier protein [Fusobacterium]MCI6152111.1 acyl carrier protein [Fusobacterium perfoetens]MDY3237998.1 acyl carrier protein [Fusobacterium perfoetens]NME35270.1 acyl carrier protein [Fusobacterium sp. FSA-380-WT-3A]
MDKEQICIIKKIIAEQLDIDEIEIKNTSNLFDELGADSFDIANIISEIEIKFEISIPYTEAKHIRKMDELLNHINDKLKKLEK